MALTPEKSRHPGRRAALAAALTASLAATSGSAAIGDRISGQHGEVVVIDGDSLQIGDAVIQLEDIDSPELGQTCRHGDLDWQCGLAAAHELHKRIFLGTLPITCQVTGEGIAGAWLATCISGTEDIAVSQLASGLAVALPDADPPYLLAAQAAQDARLGIWHTSFLPPADWRAAADDAALTANNPECLIRGITTDGGERLYLSIFDEDYERAGGDPSLVPLCSQLSARQGGWRRPGEAEAAPD